MRSILIAGGAGFIGSHLCEYLLHRGDRVICLDNFRTGHPGNVSALTNHPYFKLVEHDITMPYMIKGIDEIYNLACPASPIHYQDFPIETTKTSVIGTLNLLELARENHCRFLQASTSEVYGDPEVHPPTRKLLGTCQPERHPFLLRRRQTLCGEPLHGLSPEIWHGGENHPHLQHLRAAHGLR